MITREALSAKRADNQKAYEKMLAMAYLNLGAVQLCDQLLEIVDTPAEAEDKPAYEIVDLSEIKGEGIENA